MSLVNENRLDPALRRLVAVILLGGIMGILDGTMVAVAVDTLVAEFHSSLSTIGWVSTAYLLTLIVTIPVTGWAIDRVGAKRLWLAGLVLFVAGSVACGLAWNVGSLIVFRVAQGLGAGILDPLVLVLLARSAGPARAGRVMGVMTATLSAGPVLGPIVGGIVLDGLGWRWMFLINVPIGIAAFLLALRVVPGDSPAEGRPRDRLDVIGLALLAPGLAALGLALSQTAERTQITAWQALVPLLAGVLFLAAYAIRALRARKTPPLVDLRLFAHGSFAASVAVIALIGLATFSALFVLPLYFQQLHGYGALKAGLLVAPLGLGAVLAGSLAGRHSDRIGGRNLIRLGTLLGLASLIGLTRLGPDTSIIWPALAAFGAGVGLGSVGAPTMGGLYRTLPAQLVPQGSSVLYMLNQLGASIGIAVVALLMETAGNPLQGFHHVAWLGVAAALLILVTSAFLPGKHTESAAEASAEAVTEGASR
ncbi:DHA2 family efflux MFS transporter permease subunit [Actinomadura barringtoniae]|uniref:DHA2 family efflux MFS transporter permease subunit n=1 Tax=Actinomadura barringtoniae TaxID=1427535 RepID=A0A939P5E9_9ACTN|nr:DHA2 family efflux MFS transporter permease subunit [Actinomadura barringtoniae]MBO2445556.1 DHA2 family efflux MFS transporter permease subunit [Actinomadura barringtoniae]